jgi:hypothetical protein
MPTDQILWTCLPNGIDKAAAGAPKLRVAVLVSPRLGSTSLGVFANWPNVVQSLQFSVNITGAAAPLSAHHNTSVLDSTLWAKFFQAAPVRRDHLKASKYHQRIASNNGIRSYSVRNVASQIKSIHLAISPTPYKLKLRLRRYRFREGYL